MSRLTREDVAAIGKRREESYRFEDNPREAMLADAAALLAGVERVWALADGIEEQATGGMLGPAEMSAYGLALDLVTEALTGPEVTP